MISCHEVVADELVGTYDVENYPNTPSMPVGSTPLPVVPHNDIDGTIFDDDNPIIQGMRLCGESTHKFSV